MTRGEAALLNRELDGEVARVEPGQYIVTWHPGGCFALMTDGNLVFRFDTHRQFCAGRPAGTLSLHAALSLAMPN